MPKKLADYTRDDQYRAIAMINELGSVSKAAKVLGIKRTTLQYWNKTLNGVDTRKDTTKAVELIHTRNLIADARRQFLDEHYTELKEAFSLAIQKTKEGLEEKELPPLTTMLIAEKIAHIIDTMSVSEAAGNTQVNNLLQFCINEINGRP